MKLVHCNTSLLSFHFVLFSVSHILDSEEEPLPQKLRYCQILICYFSLVLENRKFRNFLRFCVPLLTSKSSLFSILSINIELGLILSLISRKTQSTKTVIIDDSRKLINKL